MASKKQLEAARRKLRVGLKQPTEPEKTRATMKIRGMLAGSGGGFGGGLGVVPTIGGILAGGGKKKKLASSGQKY